MNNIESSSSGIITRVVIGYGVPNENMMGRKTIVRRRRMSKTLKRK